MMGTYLIYLVRHGLAAERGSEFPDDDDRPLTSEGIERMRVQVLGLRELGVRIDRVLTSPLVRAAQTAELLASGIACPDPPVLVDALRPGGRYDAVLASLARLGDDRAVALVGHMPSIGEIASRLIGARDALAFKKGAVCCIETDALPPAGVGQLRWFLPPRALRALAH
jgi:phosphohistidine phosphatase